jgi:hypothetical protein
MKNCVPSFKKILMNGATMLQLKPTLEETQAAFAR